MNRIVRKLNVDWLYAPTDNASFARVKCAEAKFETVSLPHTNIELPFRNFSEREHCFVSWYRRHFRLPKEAKGKRVYLDFDGVMLAATVSVNGKPAGPEHCGGYTPFSFDVTDLVKHDAENVIAVRVDSTERADIPPFGHVVDYLTFGGIYRDVWLRVCDPVHIETLFARPGDVLKDRKRVEVTVAVRNTSKAPQTIHVGAVLSGRGGKKGAAWTSDVETVVPPNAVTEVELPIDELEGVELWDLDDPNLYAVTAFVDDENFDAADVVSTRVGFRTAEFADDGKFYLNGRHVKLRGLNRHQTFPYVGQAAPARLQVRDADIVKFDLACNIVRTSHYPQSPYFLDRCDEVGLLVLEEIPGWQHIGDAAWKQLSLRDVRAMVVRDRNHPSVILWGTRINESRDDHDFYSATHALAKQLDPTRQTCGVRAHKFDSELLEDVYTNNDFGYDLTKPPARRYLNTEFCGHMFPTKSFDQEERVRQHALHQAHVQNQAANPAFGSAGAIGWCAFDYNTHAVFGSGDRICYHGVSDIFREPKFAAHFYASQVEPEKRVVMEPATYWKMGDKNGGGVEPLVVFANVDEIEVVVGTKSRGKFKAARETYPHLDRPPFVITGIGGVWGGDWLPLTLHGFIGGKKVVTRKIANDGVPNQLVMQADDAQLVADGSDMTRVALRITDAFGNVLPFASQPVELSIKGPGTLVGENPFSMPGGRGAVYARAGRTPGVVTVTAETPRLKGQRVTIRTIALRESR